MRNAFVKTLTNIAQKNKNIFLLTGDLGFTVFEDFKKKYPNQYINCGVAEQNMVGVAAGLALSGKKVVVYSIIPFLTMRSFEQIRNDVCFHNLDVKFVGVGGGFSYGHLGRTHHSLEDIAIMRTLPNMKVICPADPIETELAIKFSLLNDIGPTYIRLGKSREENIHIKQFTFILGKIYQIKKGKDVTIMSTGPILKNVLEAARMLEFEGVSASVYSVPTIKPVDREMIFRAALKSKAIFTVEEHSLIGGLGDTIATLLIEKFNKKIIYKKIGCHEMNITKAGSQEHFREIQGLSAIKIYKSIFEEITKQ